MSAFKALSQFSFFALFAAASLLLALPQACGGSGGLPKTGAPLTIELPPQSTTVPVGQPASFKVIAVGTGTLAYQWLRNGNAISGATSTSYGLPAVAGSDAGAIFSVTVDNGQTSVTSASATLSVGPRAPASGDLRFQQVDSPLAQGSLASASAVRFVAGTHSFQTSSSISPLQLGEGLCVVGAPSDCAWGITFFTAPSSPTITAGFSSGAIENFTADLNATSADTVLTSLDFEPANGVLGLAYLQEAGASFHAIGETASVSALAAAASADAALGRVITAITFNSAGQAQLVSYTWAEDTTTVYETQVETASLTDVPSAATSLANQGYIITAFGGNPLYGYMMVGTRVKGDSIPRPLLTFPPTAANTPVDGYAIVGEAESLPDADNPKGVYVFLYEQ